MDAKVYPLCFTPRMYELWISVPAGARCENHCEDCMPSYQLRMKKQKRCEHPETMFVFDSEGGVSGVIQKEPT